jgi:anaerobic magnesium-protoporphyrin IX monomethyl ester cyclase
MNILLIALPSLYENQLLYPLGLGYLVGSLKHKHRVDAMHLVCMNGARDVIKSRVAAFSPQVIGLSCTTFNRGSVRRAIRWIRDWDSNIKIVVGGVHATFCFEQVLISYGADAVVIGEGEETFLDLCNALENDRPLTDVKGIAYRDAGLVKQTPIRPKIHDLDQLSLPDYTFAKDVIERLGMAFLITSRGCPAHCKFCSTSSYWGQQVRMYSPTRVVDEMQMLVSQFGVKRIFFHDDTFNLGFLRISAICKEIMDRKIEVEWGCSCRAIPVSEEMIATMVKAGCRHIGWGVESGSERILKSIEKNITLNQIKRAFDLCLPYSDILSTGAFIMVGNPGESGESIQESIDFFHTFPMTDTITSSILYVLPGTELYNSLLAQGKIDPKSWVQYDTVPTYLLEQSMWTLLQWSKRINRAGKIIPFDKQKHFWRTDPFKRDMFKLSDLLQPSAALARAINNNRAFFVRLRKMLPGRCVRF